MRFREFREVNEVRGEQKEVSKNGYYSSYGNDEKRKEAHEKYGKELDQENAIGDDREKYIKLFNDMLLEKDENSSLDLDDKIEDDLNTNSFDNCALTERDKIEIEKEKDMKIDWDECLLKEVKPWNPEMNANNKNMISKGKREKTWEPPQKIKNNLNLNRASDLDGREL